MGPIIELVLGYLPPSLLNFFPCSLDSALSGVQRVASMKFGVVSLGVAATLGSVVHAQCPDYTTFSQVC